MHFHQLPVAAILSLATASAMPPHELQARRAPTLPVNGGAHELADPPANLELKYIALGVGYQNYTCSAANSTVASNGALAVLYDVTALYPGQSRNSESLSLWDSNPSNANHKHKVPLNLDRNLPNRLPASEEGASATNPFSCPSPLTLCISSGRATTERVLLFLGHHYFDTNNLPNFVLNNGAIHVIARKLDSIAPPPTADAGKDGTGAVPWLQLADAGDSIGASYVYRVSTVGGNSHGCSTGTGFDDVSYAAYYWFYG